jgi:autophagy-related protein 9
MYTNAGNMDGFLRELYQYYVQHGVWSILLSRAFDQMSEIFAFSFGIFLTSCIDYSIIPKSKKLSEVLIPQCMAKVGWIKNFAIFCFVVHSCLTLTRNLRSVSRLFRVRDFYAQVLGISDEDLQTVSWVQVVDGIVKIQNANIATANNAPRIKKYLEYNEPQQRMNAETIANRLMRQDNYYVAIFNKEIFDFTLPIPFLGTRHFYSKSLEWCIDFCLTNSLTSKVHLDRLLWTSGTVVL